MKKVLFSMLACNLLGGVIWAQTPVQKTRAAIFDFSDTWCPPCGAYGIPTADTLIPKLFTSDKGYLINIKTSSTPSTLNAIGGNDMATNYDIVSIPTFIINKTSVRQGTTTNIAYNVQALEGFVNTATATSAEASAAATITTSGNTITVKAKTKFWAAGTGEYYMSVLLVEDDISATQASAAANPAIHRYVLRGPMATTGTALGTSPWGEQIGTGNITANTEFSKTYKVDVTADWTKANLEAYVVIFKKVSGKYEVLNIEKAKAPSTTGINNIESVETVVIYPNPANSAATLSIAATKAQVFDINITDVLGRNVYTSKNNKMVIGANTFNLMLNDIGAGIYNVEISSNEGKIVQRLSVEK